MYTNFYVVFSQLLQNNVSKVRIFRSFGMLRHDDWQIFAEV